MLLNGEPHHAKPFDAAQAAGVARFAVLPTDDIKSGATYQCRWRVVAPAGKTLLMSTQGAMVALGAWPADAPLKFSDYELLMAPEPKRPIDFGAPLPEVKLPRVEPATMMAHLSRPKMEEWRRIRAMLKIPPTAKTASPQEFESILCQNNLFGAWLAYFYDAFFEQLSDEDRAELGLFFLRGVKKLGPTAHTDMQSIFLRLGGDT